MSFRENRWAHAVTRVIACPVARTCARTPAQPAAAVPRHRGGRHWQALGLAIGALFLYTSGGTASAATCAPAASAGSAPADWATYCWLDFSSYNDTLARSVGGQTFTFTLNDGSTLTFVATVTSAAATALVPVAVPSWTGAAIGNTAFLGIPGKPVLYTATNGSTVSVTFSSISLTPPAGVTAGSTYSFVAADGESTNQNESLAWTTNGGNWIVLDQVPPITGNTYPAVSNTGTTFTETGVAGTVGAYIVGSINPTQVTTVMVAGGLQGSMFAVRYSTISLNKTLAAGRVNPADQFTYKITATASGTILGGATSTGTGNGPFTATSSFLTTPQSLTLSEVMAPGSVSTLANYGPSLTCTNANSGSTTPLPTNVATTSYVIPSINFGDAISCLFTNTKRAAVLGVTKSAPSPALKVGVNSTYTLTVTNSGNAAATTAQVKDQLPSNLNFVSASGTNWTCTAAGSLITCQFSGGTIAIGGTSTIAVTVTAPVAAGGASDTNYASIDPTGGNGAPTPGSSCTPSSDCTSSGPNTVIYINALPESGTATAGTASTPIANVVANDTVNGASATLGPTGNATIAQSGTWPVGIALNTSTGAVTTTAAVPPGSYSITYQLCDRNTPPNCATATDTVGVNASIIPATATGTAVAGTPSTPIANVAAGGTVNGSPATLGATGNATVAQSGTWPAGLTLNTSTGAVTTTAAVAPGSYSITYQLCDRNTPPDCATATDTVTVTASIIPAVQTGAAVAGTASTPIANVAAGGTVNGSPATLGATGNATVAQSGTWPPGIALNTSTGAITTTAAVPPGTYPVAYQLCDRNSPPNCATATDTVGVNASIIPATATGTAVAGTPSTPIANVAAGGTVNRSPATLGATGNATVAQSGTWPAGLTLNTSTGAVTTTATLPPGSYSVTYQLCDRSSPPNCARATDTITVSASIIPAAATGTAVAGTPSNPIANVAAGGTVNGSPATLGATGNATVAQSGTWPAGLTLNTSTGAVTTTAALPPGSYSVTYQLCDRNSPPNCATATDTVRVTANIVAVAESGSAVSGIASTPIANVAANDTVNGAAATLGATGNATVATSGTWPSGISFNTTSGAVTIAATVGAGTYAITYRLCDRNTPPNCATATDSVKVSGSALPLAIKGSAVAGIASTPIPNVAAGATVDGAAATLGPAGNATVATVGAWPTGLSLDPTTGAVSTTVALAPGTYPIRYQLCNRLAPPNCAVATDTVTVTALVGGVLLVDKTASTIQAAIGDSVQYRLRVRNASTATVTDVRLEDTLPLGFKLIAGTVLIGFEPGLPKKAANPQGTPGPALTFVLGNIAPGAILDIYYQVRLGIGADRGDGINRAHAEGVGVHSPVATAQVLVTSGAFDTSACVVGKIFVDCNGNRVQDAGEPGIPGVRLYFEDGTNVTSDENGNYSLCGLRPITHALKVDATTLPAGSRLVVLSSRNAGDGNSLFVDLRDGELHRADFAEGSCTNKVMEDVQRRRALPVLAPLPPAGKEHLGVDFESKQPSSQDSARPGGSTSSDSGERP
jgi:uncharacterized repeat protein (TIGR01451 family)